MARKRVRIMGQSEPTVRSAVASSLHRRTRDRGEDFGIPRRSSLNPRQREALRMQQTVGNQAVQRMIVQRQSDVSQPRTLKSPRFAGKPRLEACLNDLGRLRVGDVGDDVKAVQQALMDLGYDLGLKGADGIYGDFTWNAVRKFKSDQGLGWEWMGDVGPGTMSRLDELCAPTAPPPPEKEPPTKWETPPKLEPPGGWEGPAKKGPPIKIPSSQTVTIPTDIRGYSTPPAMTANRIPPSVDTPVIVVFGGTPDPSNPVYLQIEGAGGDNGKATIDGVDIEDFVMTGTKTINLKGTAQTKPGHQGKLRLVAVQGGSILAISNGFSVSSIPQNMSFVFSHKVVGKLRGIVIEIAWDSDSKNLSDLDNTEIEEAKESYAIGCLTKLTAGPATRMPGYAKVGDQHTVPAVKCLGSLIVTQTHKFDDKRTGSVDIPVAHSGFFIIRTIVAKPGSGFLGFGKDYEICTTKMGGATTAKDKKGKVISSDAGSGFASVPQDI